MSRIYFHRETGGDTEVRGNERARMDILSRDVALSVLTFWAGERHWICDLFPDGHYVRTGASQSETSVKTALSQGYRIALKFGEVEYNAWELVLNTALVMGSDLIKLCARIHAQCEIFLRIEPENRTWAANLFQRALDAGVFRKGMGWTETIAMLRESDGGPVVTSYSVCESFPATGLLEFSSNDEREAWEEKPRSEQWGECMAILRDKDRRFPQLSPEGFGEYRFGHRMDLIQLEAMHYAESAARQATGATR